VTTSRETVAGPRLSRRRVRHRSRRIDISGASFLRALAVIAVVWAWWHLWQWALVFVIAAFMAVALDPIVQWLEAHHVSRRYGALLVVSSIVVALAGFVAVAGASLSQDASELGTRLLEVRDTAMNGMPAAVRQSASSLTPSAAAITAVAQRLAGGLAGIGVALVVTVYFLLDGRRTFHWLIAFVPVASRGRALETAECGRQVIAAYIRGNIITSALAAVFTYIALLSMQVPAALLLALLAGILDFVPVVGFFLSVIPAIILGLAVSPAIAGGVATFYVGYNMVENYYIQPKVYGRELQLSDLAVIAAFLVGGTLGGVLGALVALPVAAAYPAVERIWFDKPGATDAVDEHRRIQAEPEH
jgi:predicted PurR-regulated permease PerM